MQDATNFGQRLKQKRRQLDLTQDELAHRAGCAAETVRKLEAGSRRASKAVAQQLADALQLAGSERTDFLRLARQSPTLETPTPTATKPAPAQTGEAAPLLATKLYLPRPRTHLVARPRLLARLESGLRGPLTLIAAPAGFGKTTLLADWLRQPGTGTRPLAWLALDASDSDPIQFLRYCIAALQTLAPAIGASVLPLLRLVQPPPLETLIAVLVNDLTHAPDGSLLVLDDYHVIDSLPIHQMLVFLLDHLPPQFHLVMTSRVNPPLPLARMRARGQLVEIRAADLRFTTEEAAAFLQEVMGLHLSGADVAALEARTEGWIAGLQLAAISLQDLPPAQVSAFLDSFTGSHRFVVDYLMDEVLASQPPHVQTFLRQSAILERLCGPLCDAVVGAMPGETAGVSSQQLLEQLERANLFIVPLDEERRWYRYHHLFAQVLHERLLNSSTEAEVATLHRRAALWLEQQGFVAQAINHVLAAQEWEEAARLIESHGWPLLVQGEAQKVRGWFKLLPETLRNARPYLLDLQAGLYFGANDLEAAQRTMDAAEAAFAERAPSDHSRAISAYASLLRANIARARGDIAGCTEFSQRALAILSPHEAVRRSVSMLGSALIFRVTGDVGPAHEQLVAEAVATTRRVGNLLTLFNAVLAMAELQWMQGRLRQAANTYRQASEVNPPLFAVHGLTNGASYYCGLGGLFYEWNDLDASEAHLLQGQEMIRRGLQTHGDIVTNGYITLSRLQQTRGNSEAALATLRELQTLAQERSFAPYLQARAAAALALLALRQGDLVRAARWADGNEWPPQSELDYLAEDEYLTLAHIRIVQSRHDPAALHQVLPLLERLLARAEGHQRMDSVIRLLVLRALALHTQGNDRAALDTLQDALALARPEGYLRVFVDEGQPMAQLLAQARHSDHIATPLRHAAAQLLKVLPGDGIVAASEPALATPGAPSPLPGHESLTAREVEVLHLLALGKSNQAIAQELVVEVGTVKRHVSNIMDKLQAESRLEAVARARTLKLLPS